MAGLTSWRALPDEMTESAGPFFLKLSITVRCVSKRSVLVCWRCWAEGEVFHASSPFRPPCGAP